MRIQHNSPEKIKKVERNYSSCLLGCLCFASEGHEYSLNGSKDEYSYIIDVENILEINRIWFQHEVEEVKDLIEEMCDDLGLEEQEACDLIDETEHIMDDAEGSWTVQQYQGKIAHALSYDCAESEDEQGVVYIAYCVDREMEEIAN
jgi:hypothetical protein